jgi:hypothetical protein
LEGAFHRFGREPTIVGFFVVIVSQHCFHSISIMDDGFPIPVLLLMLAVTIPVGIVIWWIRLSGRTRKLIGLSLLGIVLVIGVVSNVRLLSDPPQKPTAYYQEHAYSYDGFPHTMTDSRALMGDLIALNLAVGLASLIFLLLSGTLFGRRQDGITMAPGYGIENVVDVVVKILASHKKAAANKVIWYYSTHKILDRIQLFGGMGEGSPLGVQDAIRKWALSDDRDIRNMATALHYSGLIKDEDAKTKAMVLYAINGRFVDILNELSQMELTVTLSRCHLLGISRLTPEVITIIFSEILAGRSDYDAAWAALTRPIVDVLAGPDAPLSSPPNAPIH